MELSRRALFRTGISICIGGLAGCSAKDSSQSITIIIYNNHPEPRTLELLLEKDGQILVSQHLEIPPDGSETPVVRTTLDFSSVSQDARLNFTAELVNTGQVENIPLTIDCGPGESDLAVVRIQNDSAIRLFDSCYKIGQK